MNEIGFLSRRFPPAEGGVERFLDHLLTELHPELKPRVAAQIFGNDEDFPGVDDCFARVYPDREYHTIPVKAIVPTIPDRFRLLPCALKLLPMARKWAYEPLKSMAVRRMASVYERRLRLFFQDVMLIHSFAFDGMGLLGARVAARLKIPFVITPFMHPDAWGDNPLNIRLYNQAQAVIALHSQDALMLKRAGVYSSIIHECGVGIRPFSGDGDLFRKRHQLTGSLITFIGRMVPHKGYRELITAVRELRRSGRDISLVLIGPAGTEAKRFLDGQTGDGVFYLGNVPEQEKQDALFASDLVVLPSESEIFPVSILEAWWAGKPVIAGDIPALRALVEEGKTGIFTQRHAEGIQKAIESFLSAPEVFQRMGDAGRKKVEEKYLISHVAETLKSLYIEVVQNQNEVTRCMETLPL